MKHLDVVPSEVEQQSLEVHHLDCPPEVVLHHSHQGAEVGLG